MGYGHCRVVASVLVVLGCACACKHGVPMQEEDLLLSSSFDYGDALGKAILFFEGQRLGKLPAAGQRVRWRGDSALTDGMLENVRLCTFTANHKTSLKRITSRTYNE